MTEGQGFRDSFAGTLPRQPILYFRFLAVALGTGVCLVFIIKLTFTQSSVYLSLLSLPPSLC